ncbi:MAG TPA: TldD/PmbA family protein [Candidatus Acidoferrales bacterium]|jgi:predicted Zn-dependent protease|nr:TldD/PmbA family protein [Candidatus Acidoferrales bacterium]
MRPSVSRAAKPSGRRAKSTRIPRVRPDLRLDLEALGEKIIKLSEADETEVEIHLATDALTRFANNTIHQNVAEQILHISVRAVVDGRTARASSNKTDPESLRNVVSAAAQLARNQPRNPDLLPMLASQKYQKVSRFSSATAGATPQIRAREVIKVCCLAEKVKQTSAGILSSGHAQSVLMNSKGLLARYEQTRAEFSVTMLEENSSGWAKATSFDIREIDPLSLAESASRKAATSRNPRELAPGHYTAILEPAAVLDLVGFLFYDFAGTAIRDKLSCFTGRLGKKIFSDNITLWDDVYHPLQLGEPFDGEGVPRQKILLIDRGVPTNMVYSRATAKKMKAKPTGHGFELPNEHGEAPMNLVWSGGDKSIEDMVASTERGVLVTRLWYIRDVDPYKKILTGMTRDGTFLVENGRIAGGIRNFRFNQSVIDMLGNVETLGPAVRSSGEESFDMVVPAMKVKNFHFSEVTKF